MINQSIRWKEGGVLISKSIKGFVSFLLVFGIIFTILPSNEIHAEKKEDGFWDSLFMSKDEKKKNIDDAKEKSKKDSKSDDKKDSKDKEKSDKKEDKPKPSIGNQDNDRKPGNIKDMINPGQQQLEDNINKDSEKFKEEKFDGYKEQKQKEKTKDAKDKAYATKLFKDSNNNDTLMYYDAQTNSGVPTVESKIKDATDNPDEGVRYASYLNSLHSWNLYKTYTNQVEVGGSIPIKGIKFLFGGFILICMYIMSGIDKLLSVFADLFDYLNIFKYIANDNGEIPQDNPLSFFNPVVHFFNKLTAIAKIIVAMFFGWVAFRLVSGIGRARARGHYFKSKFSKGIYAMIAILFGAAFISGCFGIISDVLRDSEDVASDAVNDIPTQMIVDNRQYIDNSLTNIKGKKGAEGTNDGYILNHDPEQGFPTTYNQIETKVPSQKLITYMNTDNKEDIKEKLDGKDLIKKWMFSESFTSNDLNSMYNLTSGDSWSGLDKSARITQFKLAPQANGVKLFGGKDMFSFDLKDISIESASLAGNTGFGQFLNAVKLGALVIGISFVVFTLYLAIFRGLISALKDFIVNFSLSTIGVVQAFFGVIATAAITLLGIGLVFALIRLYPEMVKALDFSFTEKLNQDDQFNGVLKQTLQVVVTLFVLWFCSKLVFSIRKGVMTVVQEWFTRILEALNPDASMSPSMSADRRALDNAVNSNLAGQQMGENAVDGVGEAVGHPIDSAKSGVESLKDIKDKGQEKVQSLNDLMNREEDGEGLNKGSNQRSSQFSGSVNGVDTGVDDPETQGEKLEGDIQEGISNLEKQSDRGVNNNLNEQEKRIGQATEAFDNLNEAEQELSDAKDNYKNLQENGASSEELEGAKTRVNDAQKAYDHALGNSQEASRALARTGASVGDIAQGRVQSMQDYNSANSELKDAENNLDDLINEKNDMEAFGASKYDMKQIDKRIGDAEDKVSIAKEKQKLAKDAYEANVNNPVAEKDARNDLISAQQSEHAARREFKEANTHGNLTDKQYSNLQNAANSLSSDVDQYKNVIDQDVQSGEAKRHALNFMKNNGGNAFASSDYGVQNSELERADQRVSNLKQQLSQSPKNKDLKEELSQAQAHQANVQTATNAMQNGTNVNDGLNAQEQIVSQAYQKRVNAEKSLSALKHKSNAGQLVDRDEMKAAESNYNQAYSGHQHAERVLSGMQALHAVGARSMEPTQLQVMNKANDDNLDNLYKQQKQFAEVQTTISTLGQGGMASPQQTSNLSTVQKRVRQGASEKARKAREQYDATVERLEKLKKQERNGMPVRSDIKRVEASKKQAEKQMVQAEQKQSFVESQGVQIRRTGKTMVNNIKGASEKIKENTNLVTERKQAHQNILKTGGLSTKQLQDYKKQVVDDREKADRNKQQFLRERASRIENMRKELASS